jgi:hypothetical protein
MFPLPPDHLPIGFNVKGFVASGSDHLFPHNSASPTPKMSTMHAENEPEKYCPYSTPDSANFHFSPISSPYSTLRDHNEAVLSSLEKASPVILEKAKEKGKARAPADSFEDEPPIEHEDEETASSLTRQEKQQQAEEDAAIALKFAMAELMGLGLSEEQAYRQVCGNEPHTLSGGVTGIPSTTAIKPSTEDRASRSVPIPQSRHRAYSSSIDQDPLLARFEDNYETHIISKHVPNVASPFLSTGWLPPAHGTEYIAKPSTSSAGSPLSSRSIQARRMAVASAVSIAVLFFDNMLCECI